MLLVEIILAALFLAAAAIGTAYFFTQTKVTMSSSSQTMECQTIVKQALENTVSLGSRLYGYRINYRESEFSYKPLFIKYNTSKPGNIEHVKSGSELHFPPDMYRTLYENLGVMDGAFIQDPETNTGDPLIGDTYPYDLSTSVLIVNSVNALQHLYNSDNGFLNDPSGMGKEYTSGSMFTGAISEVLKKYEEDFDLENLKFYIKITPIDLTTNEEMTSPPSQILTRPRFHNPQGAALTPALNVLGDEDAGFEITVTLKYEREDQEYTCNASHRFSHSGKTITKRVEPLPIDLTSLKTGAEIDLKNNADLNTPPLTPAVPSDLKMVSCDTHGTGYNDITLTVDFSSMGEGQQIGTVILCRMNSYCRSYGYDPYDTCVTEPGEWRRCHNITPASGQSWTYTSQLISSQKLEMKFSSMKIDRRYELDVGEFSMAGHNLRFKNVAKFYIDAKRPEVTYRRITNNLVGRPGDAEEGRNYGHPHPLTAWRQPLNSFYRRWLQCKTGTVEFAADRDDQFTHNLYVCDIKGKREDGTNKGTGVPTSPNRTSDCGGELSVTQHGRYTITFTPSDTCGSNPAHAKDLVWDADLPGSFEVKNFTKDPEWFYNTSKDAYPIDTVVPAKNTAGKFPKHYSVDCDDNFQGSSTREDGNSGILKCRLSGSVPDHDDGCNLRPMRVQYYHVCGEAQVGCNHSKKKKWGVYTPLGESCVNVWCEPSLSCCDINSGTCNGVSDKQCGDPITRHCTNPKGGTQAKADEVLSGCPPLGLNDCSYQLPCEATSPCSETGPTSACNNKRQGTSCNYTRPRTCIPDDSGLNFSCNSSGTYTAGCDSGTCTVSCNSVCTRTSTYSCDCNCSTCTDSNGDDYDCNCSTCTCSRCDEYKQQARPTSMSPRTFSGMCGVPSGGCSKKGVGGGNLSQEVCDIRPPICCDRTTECCPGDTHLTNSNCTPPPPVCNPANECCGLTCATNPLHCCGCDSSTRCCSGNTHPTNPHCPPPPVCDPSKRCCNGDTCSSNPDHCCGPKVDGKCSTNGCSSGEKKSNTDGSWICEGEGGGSDDICPVPCDTNTECCDGVGQCDECSTGGQQTKQRWTVTLVYDTPLNCYSDTPTIGHRQVLGPTRDYSFKPCCSGYTEEEIVVFEGDCGPPGGECDLDSNAWFWTDEDQCSAGEAGYDIECKK